MTKLFNRLVTHARIAVRAVGVPARGAMRRRVEEQLSALARGSAPIVDGPILIDAMWDNPNYWLRATLVRAALGATSCKEVGLVGRWRRMECAATLREFGVDVVRPEDFAPAGDFATDACRLVESSSDAGDVLLWRLPEGFPATIFYDAILKRQRTAAVDLADPGLAGHVAEGLEAIALAARVIDGVRPAFVVLSHAVNFHYAALAWVAALRGIPAVVLFGNYGTPRFWRIAKPSDLFDGVDRPRGPEIDAIPADAADELAQRGRRYLERRRAGQTRDIGAQYAYARRHDRQDRAAIAGKFGWAATTPIVAVYASNWFDFPHACGMTQFRDFLDWLNATVEAAKANTAVNWLFKPHPCDEWYGGVTLKDLMPGNVAPHIRLADPAWNGASVMAAVDAIVTYHGTIGIEAAAEGLPVLAADRGWYDDCGFVLRAPDRAGYLAALDRDWWRDLDPAAVRRRAEIFAGWYFEPPDWQGRFVTGDDSEQGKLYPDQIAILADASEEIDREIAMIRDWFASGHPYYHTYKVARSLGVALA